MRCVIAANHCVSEWAVTAAYLGGTAEVEPFVPKKGMMCSFFITSPDGLIAENGGML